MPVPSEGMANFFAMVRATAALDPATAREAGLAGTMIAPDGAAAVRLNPYAIEPPAATAVSVRIIRFVPYSINRPQELRQAIKSNKYKCKSAPRLLRGTL